MLLVYSLAAMVLLIAIGGQPATAREGFAMLAAKLGRDQFRLARSAAAQAAAPDRRIQQG